MVKITILSFKNIIKYIRFLFFIFVFLFSLYWIYNITKASANIDYIAHNIDTELDSFSLKILYENIPSLKLFATKDTSNVQSADIIEYVLYSELPIINTSFLVASETEPLTETLPSAEENSLTYAEDNLKTEVIENNVPNKYTNEYLGVEIKNGTNYTLTDDILNPNSLEINTNDIIIFHTHTCESYTPSDTYQYEASGTFRTINLERSVVKVGSELTTYMLSYGYNVFHDSTYHDYPSYSGSYGRSMATVENMLTTHPNTDVIIDIHRDAIGDTSYAPSVKIGDEIVSQLMFVIGTDGGGLEHPNWQNNLKFAIMVQSKANELYPGLFKPIVLRNSRYNQQLGNGACIIEVGATGNTLEQSLLSMKYLSKVLNEVLKKR